MPDRRQLTQAQRDMLLDLACAGPGRFKPFPMSAWLTALSLENRQLITCYHAKGTRQFVARLAAPDERRCSRHPAI